MAERAVQEKDAEYEMDLNEPKNESEKEQPEEAKTVVYSEVTGADRPIFRWLKQFGVAACIIIFLGACLWQVNSMKNQSEELDQTMAELQQQIEDEKAKELEIKVEKKYYQSIAYREQMARDRCKLIYPNEILISIQQ